jgi:ABC-type Fe3+ transport system permease subunit/DNA-binding beta-propeller fold protein YncE
VTVAARSGVGAGAVAVVGLLLAMACAGLVGMGIVVSAWSSVAASAADLGPLWDWVMIVRTVGVAAGIGVLATVLGLPAAWAMRGLSARWVPLIITPLLLPSYLVFTAWSVLRGPGTVLGDALEGGPAWQWVLIGHAQAIVGLALWSWPLAAVVVGAGARGIERSVLESLRLSGAGVFRRGVVVLAVLRGPMCSAIGVVMLVMLGSAVPLHLANIDTASLSLWRSVNEGAPMGWVWASALPLLVLASAAGWWIGGRLSRSADVSAMEGAEADSDVARAPRGPAGLLAGVVWLVSVFGPIALLAGKVPGLGALLRFWPTSGAALSASAAGAVVVGVAGVVIAVSMAAGMAGAQRSVARRAAAVCLRVWLVLALVPGLLIGAALAGAGGTLWFSFLTESSAGLIVAHVARFGAVAALAGWWASRLEPPVLADMRRLYAGDGLAAWARTSGAAQAGLVVAAGMAMGLLSLHEIESAVVLAPPGDGVFARRMLALLHYLRDDELSAAAVIVGGVGVVVSLMVAMLAGTGASALRRASRVLPLVLAFVMVAGCERNASPSQQSGAGAAGARVIGSVGRGEGQFVIPRCLDADATSIWVIDKSGRMQRLMHDGAHLGDFRLPEVTKGYPTGVSIGPDGNVYIADTHEHRVLIVSATDAPALRGEFGTYGHGPGEMVYPTDVAFLTDERGVIVRMYVSEYGGNDRVNAFDASHTYLFSFGRPGNAADAEPQEIVFARPQSVAVWRAKNELVVADAANHRLGRFTVDGALVRWLGKPGGLPGTGPGEFSYPYGLAVLDDGTALVSEFGSSRVQRVDLETGRGIAIVGGPGREAGRFVTPWGVAAIGEQVFVLDTGNHRVQSLPMSGFGGVN